MVDITSPSKSPQKQHSSQPTLSPKTPIKNPIQLNRDRLFKSPLSNISTPVQGPAVDPLALSENDPRMTLSAGHSMDHLTPNSHVQPQMSLTQNEGAQLGFHPNTSTLHPFAGNVQQQQLAHPQNQESPGIFGHQQPSNFELNDHHNQFYQNQQPQNLVNPSHLNTESLNLHNTPGDLLNIYPSI
ncbi:unnamed protein product [Meloidogyne enterolobii]|uniref:Uncharacterized protein n=1 Tax=Meloidogyne enterolobii TaxID=390850 RepID=A0ACB1AUH1_MELEN